LTGNARRVPSSVVLDIGAEGDGAQSLGQLLPQQNLFQFWRRSVLREEGEDLFWVSLVGWVRRLLGVHQRDGPSGFWRMDGIGGGLSRGLLHVSRGPGGVLGDGRWDRSRILGRLCGGRVTLEGVVVREGVGVEGVEVLERR